MSRGNRRRGTGGPPRQAQKPPSASSSQPKPQPAQSAQSLNDKPAVAPDVAANIKTTAPPRTPLLDSLRQTAHGESLPQEKARQILRQEAERVPMEYRAQTIGRCQRQYIKKPQDAPPDWRSAIQQWIDEWVERIDSASPFSSDGLHVVEAQGNSDQAAHFRGYLPHFRQ